MKTSEFVAKVQANLKNDLLKAHEAAKKAAVGEDGGSCNFDAAAFHLPWGMRLTKAIKEAVYEASTVVGLSGYWTKHFGSNVFVVGPGAGGQGITRTKAAEAMAHTLQELGWDVSIWYQMD